MTELGKVVSLSVALLAGPLFASEAGEYGGGKWHREGDRLVLVQGDRTLSLEARFVGKGWRFRPVAGSLAGVAVKDGVLLADFRGVAPAGAEFQDNLPMLLVVSGDAASYSDTRLRLGPQMADFKMKSKWGHGLSLESEAFKLCFTLERAVVQSFWNNPGTSKWSVRLHLNGEKQKDGSTVYATQLAVRSDPKLRIVPPPDIVAQKREQYTRVLVPPQEAGFDPSRILARIAGKDMTRAAFGDVEDLFDARSRLYAVAERLSLARAATGETDRLVARGYAALSAMDLGGLTNACAALEARLVTAEGETPSAPFSPLTWVKCFTQWGYRRAADGCSVSEPNPWLIQGEDGFRMNVAQDERVVIAHAADTARDFETRYIRPMTDVHFVRTRTSTKWLLPDRTVTFSLLTPVVDVDGIERLTLSGFTSEPETLRWTDRSGRSTGLRLVSRATIAAETIPSVLMDFAAPPPAPKAYTRGRQTIDPETVDRPYLRVNGANWSLALFPGEKPVAAAWEKGVLTVEFPKRTHVGILRLRDNLSTCEQNEICEFFARTSLAYPTDCRETVKGDRVGWKYAYLERANAWGASARKIAPVPPLVEFAGVRVPGMRRCKYPTKWGLFSYCEGDQCACTLPAFAREPRLRGVNVGIWDKDEKWEGHLAQRVNWVRACFGGPATSTLADQCAQLERRLAQYGARTKFLVDPHCREYRVNWSAGMSADPAVEARFLNLWDAVSKVGARHPKAIEGYDLYNEPGLVAGAEERWRTLNLRVAGIIRKNHPGAKIYYSAIYGGNPNGLFNLTPLGIPEEVVTYHFYSPHGFTHQKVDTKNPGDTYTFYPAWQAPIDWAANTHFGGTTVDWYDRWTLQAILLPAYEHLAAYGRPLHVGEFAVVGYANGKAPRGAFLWTRDATELIEGQGASWHLWNGGFGLGNAFVREYVHALWRKGGAE